MARKIVSRSLLLMCVILAVAVSTIKVVEGQAKPNYAECHATCEKQCLEGPGGNPGFCKIKCDNFCSDNILVTMENEKMPLEATKIPVLRATRADEDNHSVGEDITPIDESSGTIGEESSGEVIADDDDIDDSKH